MIEDPDSPERSVAEWIALAPSDAQQARRAVAPYASMTPDERLRALAVLNAEVDAVLGGRVPERADGERPFWMYWKGLVHGRPR